MLVIKSVRVFLFLGFALSLMGCKEVLFSNITELEANEMVAILAADGIDSSRTRDKDGVYSLLVQADEVAVATVTLKAAGLPRQKFKSLGDVFSASGIIGTPFEQHARFVYAMNEELSRTLTQIDGVKSARVLISLPQQSRLDQNEALSTASVTVYYEEQFEAEKSVSKIKQLVSHSLPSLPYGNVSVVFFATSSLKVADDSPDVTVNTASVFPDNLLNRPVPGQLHYLLYAVIGFLLLLGLRIILKLNSLRAAMAETQRKVHLKGRK